MVNKGRTHRELGNFFMISSNLIKSDDESVIEIRQFDTLIKLSNLIGIKNYSIWI